MPGTFVYTPPAATVLSAGAAQTLSTTFTPTDAANYNTANKSVAINVLKATPVITWANPADIVYGTALSATQLNATTTVPGTFVYTPPATTVLSAGAAQTLSATFTPTDAANYNTANKSVAINVAQGDAGHHLGESGRHRLRHGAERDAAERDDDRARHLRLHAAGDHGPLGRRGADAVGDLHADRRGELQHREQVGRDQRRSRRRRSSPGRSRPTSSTARRSARRS